MPITAADPRVGFSNPTQVLMSVDLPAAFGPTNAVMPPAGMSRSIPPSAQTPRRYRLARPFASRTASIIGSPPQADDDRKDRHQDSQSDERERDGGSAQDLHRFTSLLTDAGRPASDRPSGRSPTGIA